MLLLCFEEGNRASCLWERERILGLSFLLFPASRFYCFHFYLGKGSFHACSLFEASKDSFVCYRILLIMKMVKRTKHDESELSYGLPVASVTSRSTPEAVSYSIFTTGFGLLKLFYFCIKH
ncbi:uncharacterized protein LOC127120112 isoform X1 [Lathyrus oleraceus]|uniref:uncharacterized protein LOC127120111 isoform X1 n=1 Tax=Pisum sativum TaxID=3888 RepID=UPI0021D04076|nr:uncharacterized protein LOC127120111 isoform X1 [Pisum sativum]XP_050906459.1 uncharacterized protein LOC127120112 isoform X1 [Pisum sativum]